MQRAVIIGPPGSGKSTFANNLSEITKLPITHLDVYWNDPANDFQGSSNRADWIEFSNALADKDKWIMDGNFSGSLQHRLDRADTIFYFDMPTWLALKGIYMRRFDKSGRIGMPDKWEESVDFGFLKYVAIYRHKYHKGIQELLSQQASKDVVIFKTHKQVNKYLANLRPKQA